MSANNSLEAHSLLNVRSFALSESQLRTQVLNNKRLFSNHKEKHLIELTEIEADASHYPVTSTFRSAADLAGYLHDNGHGSVQRRCGMDI
jgi:hypothetical protein